MTTMTLFQTLSPKPQRYSKTPKAGEPVILPDIPLLHAWVAAGTVWVKFRCAFKGSWGLLQRRLCY